MGNTELGAAWQAEAYGPGITLRSLWSFMGWPKEDDDKRPFGVPVSGAELRCPEWPPDLFALAAAALRKSGAYTVPIRNIMDVFPLDAEDLAHEWRNSLSQTISAGSNTELPPAVVENWRIVARKDILDLPLFRLIDDKRVAAALVVLLGIADQAGQGVGLPSNQGRTLFHEAADRMLFPSQFGSTLCRYVHPSAGRVLPKMHTAQCGLTIRSFSHHLAFCETDEVQPSWLSIPGARGDVENIHHFNVLIAPWPQVVAPGQIRPVGSEKRYSCFDFNVESSQLRVVPKLVAMAKEAEQRVGSLDAVVMPELALSSYDYRAARAALLRRGLLFVCGVGNRRAENRLNVDVPLSKNHAVHLRQRKHHRWKIDENQIKQYGLGARLNLANSYWERIAVDDRKLMFVVLRNWLVATALICEDLARHDPVGELIRGIGPNLVIALLMDGPQLEGRWASRYAAGLADDPGSSVLSVTSLGMAELSRPPSTKEPPSRVVALWKDAFCGRPQELAIPHGSDGLVITLAVRHSRETTADLRTGGNQASFPTLAGVHPVRVPDKVPELAHEDMKGRWISPYHAFLLAKLAQREDLSAYRAPEELAELRDEAYRIGRELWRLKKPGAYAPHVRERPPYPNLVADPASEEEIETARVIHRWHQTNGPVPGMEKRVETVEPAGTSAGTSCGS